MPQDELLSRILFGTSITNLSAPEALQLASAVAALQSGTGSLDPINALRKAIGLDRLRIVPADVATGQKTAIGAGKYITRKLYVEVVTDGAGLFRDAGRISDDPLALAAVDRLDHRPLERERARQQGLLRLDVRACEPMGDLRLVELPAELQLLGPAQLVIWIFQILDTSRIVSERYVIDQPIAAPMKGELHDEVMVSRLGKNNTEIVNVWRDVRVRSSPWLPPTRHAGLDPASAFFSTFRRQVDSGSAPG